MAGSRLTQAEFYVTGIAELSALTFVSPEIGFLAFSDDSAAVWRIKLPAGLGGELMVEQVRDDDQALIGIEGASYDAQTSTVRVLSEDSRRIHELAVSGGPQGQLDLGPPRRLKPRLARVQRKRSRGYEGLTTLHAELSPDRQKWTVAVNERSPRRICFFDPVTLRPGGYATLPRKAKPLFPDLSDLTFGSDGTLYLLSDEGCRWGTFTLQQARASAKAQKPGWKLALQSSTPIATEGLPLGDAPRLQPEALTFDDRGDLWVAAEANGLLLRFARS